MPRLAAGSVDLVLVDVPYGATRNKWDAVIDLVAMWQELGRLVKPGGAIVMTAQAPFDKVLGASNIKHLKHEWIWEKEAGTGFLNAKRAPLKNHENVLVFCDRQPTYNPQMRQGFKPYKCTKGHHGSNYGLDKGAVTESNGERYPLTVIKFNRDRVKLHPTQKPVALMEYMVRTYSNSGETVLDFTMGAGSTGVACMNAGRNFIGIELDPAYFVTAADRIEKARLAALGIHLLADMPAPTSEVQGAA
jgi:site-specific DNA-methyltransferase (adenine-specific)